MNFYKYMMNFLKSRMEFTIGIPVLMLLLASAFLALPMSISWDDGYFDGKDCDVAGYEYVESDRDDKIDYYEGSGYSCYTEYGYDDYYDRDAYAYCCIKDSSSGDSSSSDECSVDSDCGSTSYDDPFCQDGDVYRTKKSYDCVSGDCQTNLDDEVYDSCGSGFDCQDAECVETCVPMTCGDYDYECGSFDDGCGGSMDCGTCAPDMTCQLGSCVTPETDEDTSGDEDLASASSPSFFDWVGYYMYQFFNWLGGGN